MMPTTTCTFESVTTSQHDRQRRKCLRWAESSSQEEAATICVDDLSEEEIHEIWYDKKDYKAFKKHNMTTVKFILKKLKKNTDYSDFLQKRSLCERGLERIIAEEMGSPQCKARKIAINTVLEEQSDQRYFGTFSPDFIAELYQEVSMQDQKMAYLKGLQDEKDACACHEPSQQAENGSIKILTATTDCPLLDPIKPKPFALPCRTSSKKGRSMLQGRQKPFLISRTAKGRF